MGIIATVFTPVARMFKAADNALVIVENVTEAGAVASEGLVQLAENFNKQNQAKLDKAKESIDAKIAAGDLDFTKIL